MNHLVKSLIFGIAAIFSFLVASQILNKRIEKEEKITQEIPDNAIQTLTIDYRETSN